MELVHAPQATRNGEGRTERQPCGLSEASVENRGGAISAAQGILALAWR